MFETILTSAMRAMPTFALQLGVTLAILVASVLAYRAITPMDETKLIKEGNIAAATAFGAAILSLALPLGTCLARSVSIPDIVIWGAIACAVQLGTFAARPPRRSHSAPPILVLPSLTPLPSPAESAPWAARWDG